MGSRKAGWLRDVCGDTSRPRMQTVSLETGGTGSRESLAVKISSPSAFQKPVNPCFSQHIGPRISRIEKSDLIVLSAAKVFDMDQPR